MLKTESQSAVNKYLHSKVKLRYNLINSNDLLLNELIVVIKLYEYRNQDSIINQIQIICGQLDKMTQQTNKQTNKVRVIYPYTECKTSVTLVCAGSIMSIV